jgi:hypothetical protein
MFVVGAEEDDMATIRNKELLLETPAAKKWEALKDFHAIDKRVAPGLVVKSVPEGAHVITFSNGTVAREALVSAEGTNGGSSMRSNTRLKHYQGSRPGARNAAASPERSICCPMRWPATSMNGWNSLSA